MVIGTGVRAHPSLRWSGSEGPGFYILGPRSFVESQKYSIQLSFVYIYTVLHDAEAHPKANNKKHAVSVGVLGTCSTSITRVYCKCQEPTTWSQRP